MVKSLARRLIHSSGAVWESRWPSWAVRPNEPSGFRRRKDILNYGSALVTTCPKYVNWHLRTLLSITSSSSDWFITLLQNDGAKNANSFLFCFAARIPTRSQWRLELFRSVFIPGDRYGSRIGLAGSDTALSLLSVFLFLDDVGLNVLGCRVDILGTNCNFFLFLLYYLQIPSNSFLLIGRWLPNIKKKKDLWCSLEPAGLSMTVSITAEAHNATRLK